MLCSNILLIYNETTWEATGNLDNLDNLDDTLEDKKYFN